MASEHPYCVLSDMLYSGAKGALSVPSARLASIPVVFLVCYMWNAGVVVSAIPGRMILW